MLEIDFEGSISTTSVSAFRRMLGYGEAAFAALPPGRHLKYRALLNSPGGSVGAAMEFGRLLREKSASTNVNPNQQCVSACVLALIGGPERSVDGEVGIHRPYLDFDGKAQPPTAAQIQTTTNQVRDQMVAYLAEMNVPRKIVDDMMLIPPERVMKLNHRDLAAYGIFSNDPVYNEEIDIRIAKEFGLPRAEYMKRKLSVIRYCSSLPKSYSQAFQVDDPFDNFSPADLFRSDSCAGPIMAAPPGKEPSGVKWEYS